MDEIGRGTSTFDGLALASGIAAHLHDKTQAFTLFATHYFELTEFPAKHHCAVNVHVSAAESGADIVFLHEIQPGPASRSYGIQVARLAGMPAGVVNHARHALDRAGNPANAEPRAGRLVRTAARGRGARAQRRGSGRGGAEPGRAEPARGARRAVPTEETGRKDHDLLRRHQTQCRAGVPVRLAHQRGRGPHQHLPQDDRVRAARATASWCCCRRAT